MVKKRSIESIKQLAKQRGGILLSKEYLNKSAHLRWKCNKGHEWSTSLDSVQQGHWCPECAKNKRLNIEDMQDLAKVRGGRCLSTVYINNHTPLEWLCADGHKFEARANDVKRARWCPKCTRFFTEEKCRTIFESIFQTKFPANRSILGEGLELDGFNDELKLAFEYQGKQHYEYLPYFFNNENEFKALNDRDQAKVRICKERRITLIVIPYYYSNSDEILIDYIFSKLIGAGFTIAKPKNISLESLYCNLSQLNKIRHLCEKKGGKCLSAEYINKENKLLFECSQGHKWLAKAGHILNEESWCPQCAGKKKYSIDDMNFIVEEAGLRCISSTYSNVFTPLEWECSLGHKWRATPHQIIRAKNRGNLVCPICTDKKVTLLKAQKLADNKKGKLLSKEYKNNHSLLAWQCFFGHKWKASYNSIKDGHSWCPSCARNTMLTLNDLESLANLRGGKCKATEYVNNRTKMLWECSEGHQWENSAGHIKDGQWCPICSRMKRLRKPANEVQTD